MTLASSFFHQNENVAKVVVGCVSYFSVLISSNWAAPTQPDDNADPTKAAADPTVR